MLFNALHREGSNLAMTSGRFAAEAVLEALRKVDVTGDGLRGYVSRMQDSYVLKDLKKYRRFNRFRHEHHELFTTLPQLGSMAAREMLTVNGVPKKEKQNTLWKKIRGQISLFRLFRLFLAAWRSVR